MQTLNTASSFVAGAAQTRRENPVCPLVIFYLLIMLAVTGAGPVLAEPTRAFLHAPGASAEVRASWDQFAVDKPVSVGVGSLPSDLSEIDVVILHEPVGAAQRGALAEFLAAGGGVVVLNPEVIRDDSGWWLERVGGALTDDTNDHRDTLQGLYFQDRDHPITLHSSNFDLPDQKIWFNHEVSDDSHVLAVSYHDLRIFAPQMWTYQGDAHRAFVWFQGHRDDTATSGHLSLLLMRGIIWANGVDELPKLTQEQHQALFYPPHGPVHPNEAVDTLELEPGFNVRLMVAEPQVVNPISIDWDAQGRLWVAQTPEYPFKHDQDNPGRDKITIHTDTTGDGQLDHTHVFADDFELVTSLVVYEDGALVLQPPHLYFVRDTNGDGRADTREIVLTGFNRGDTHASSSNMVMGLDGWIYLTVGYSRANLTSGDGSREFGQFTEGVIRIKPDGSAAESVARKGGNTWGLDVDEIGELFWTQATSGRHLFHIVLPEYVLERGRIGNTSAWHSLFNEFMNLYPAMRDDRPAYVQVSPTGGITAVAGSTVYTGGAWPEEFHRFHFISEPTYWLSHVGIIEGDGITYTGSRHREEVEFLAGRDLWYCPIHHRVGPDGAMYIVDFYNQAVSHNDIRMPGSYHGPGNAAVRPDRDQTMGRIYRVQHDEAVQYDPPRLHEAGPAELVEKLAHPNQWFRMTAQRLLVERRPAGVTAELLSMARSHESHLARLHALWTLEHLNRLDDEVLVAALEDSHHGVRRTAQRVAAERGSLTQSVVTAIIDRLEDDDLRVQLYVLVALQAAEPSDAVRDAALKMFTREGIDNYRRSAALGVLAQNPMESIASLAGSGMALGDIENPIQSLVTNLIRTGDTDAVASLIKWLAGAEVEASFKTTILGVLADSDETPQPEWDPSLEGALTTLASPDSPNLAAISVTLATEWAPDGGVGLDVSETVRQLTARLRDEGAPSEERADAAHVLVRLPASREPALQLILEILPTADPSELAPRLLTMLGRVDDAEVGQALVDAVPSLAPAVQGIAVDHLLQRSEWTRMLIAALSDGDVPLGIVSLTHRHMLRQHPDDEIASLARDLIDRSTASDQEIQALTDQVLSRPISSGNITAGEAIFQSCLSCHTYEDRGVAVGPDITGIGSHSPRNLLGIILDASLRTPGTQYTAYNVETRDGQVYMGLIAEQDTEGLTLRQAGGGEQRINRDNIVSVRSTGQSLMPNYDAFGEDGLRALLAYLNSQSRFRVIDLSEAFTADSTSGMWTNPHNPGNSLYFNEFGLVSAGSVPFEIAHPSRIPEGNNVIVLKGGSGPSAQRPQEVRFSVGFAAARLHILGGVGYRGYPWGDEEGHDLPVLEVEVHYADGQVEQHVLRNGEHFSDFIRRTDVSRSTYAPGLVGRNHQLRVIELDLGREETVDHIKLRSFDNHVLPATVAITAELEPGS